MQYYMITEDQKKAVLPCLLRLFHLRVSPNVIFSLAQEQPLTVITPTVPLRECWLLPAGLKKLI